MSKEIILGKINKVKFGIGGYNDCMIGIFFDFRWGSSGVSSSKSFLDPGTVEWSDNCKWTEKDRSEFHDELIRYISGLMSDAKVSNIEDLKNAPVEITLEDGQFESFRILTEVL